MDAGNRSFVLLLLATTACGLDAIEAPPVAGGNAHLEAENGVDWNGVDWNGVDWNGVDWNGVDWNGVDWNGVDWNGVDWNAVVITGIVGATGQRVAVHPSARPLFFFVTAVSNGVSFPLAIPSPGAAHMLAHAPSRAAAAYFLKKSFEIAYGPGFRAWIDRVDLDGDGALEPVVAQGRLGLAPSLVGLGPYDESQVMAWSSHIGNLLNLQPFRLSLRAFDVEALSADATERARYLVVDLRAAIGRLIPPPGATVQAPVMVLLRDRLGMRSIDGEQGDQEDQLDQRRSCPLGGAMAATCYDGAVTVVDLQAATREGAAGCVDIAGLDSVYGGTVAGRCWVNLPWVSFEQVAAIAPMTASFVDMRSLCPGCAIPPTP